MSESPTKAILKSPISATDVGGDAEFGRLVVAATLSGKSTQDFAEMALIKTVMEDLRISEQAARELLSALESGSEQSRKKS